MALIEWLPIANVTVAMHQQGHQLLARLCLNYFQKEHKKQESKAKSSDTNGYTLVLSDQRIPHPEKYVCKKVWLAHERKNTYSPSEFSSTPLHQWLCQVACQLTVSTSHIQFGFFGHVLPNLTSRLVRKLRLTYNRLEDVGLSFNLDEKLFEKSCLVFFSLASATDQPRYFALSSHRCSSSCLAIRLW